MEQIAEKCPTCNPEGWTCPPGRVGWKVTSEIPLVRITCPDCKGTGYLKPQPLPQQPQR